MNKKTIVLGTVVGIISAVYTVLMEKQLLSGSNMLLGFVTSILSIAVMIYLILSIRKENEGILPFKEGFVQAFLYGVISTIIASIASYLNLFVIKSQEQIQELVQLMATNMTQKGMSEQMAIEAAQKTFTSPLMQLAGFGGGIVFSAILAAIFAGIFKKNEI